MRKRYVWVSGVGFVPAAGRAAAKGPEIMPDIEAFRSPVDGSMITSRRELRRHNARNGVRNVDPSEDPRRVPRRPPRAVTKGIARELYRAMRPQ